MSIERVSNLIPLGPEETGASTDGRPVPIRSEVINDAPKSFRFNDVYEEVQDRTGEEISDDQVRVALRFFTHVGAVKHSRAHFTHDGKKSFRRTAKEAWDDLQRRTDAGQVPA